MNESVEPEADATLVLWLRIKAQSFVTSGIFRLLGIGLHRTWCALMDLDYRF
jgi:hypothetical protein